MTTASAPATAGTLIHRPANYFVPLNLGTLFPISRPLEVELGSGDGSFMAIYAAAHRERNFLGVERLMGRLKKLDRKGRRAGLDNLGLIRIEAGYFMEYLLPPGTVTALHIYFPDPWPKRKHLKNRLINERFTELSKRALVTGGTVYLRTDHVEYFMQMQEVFGASKDFEAVETPEELSAITTDFERQWNSQGIPTNRSAYRLKG